MDVNHTQDLFHEFLYYPWNLHTAKDSLPMILEALQAYTWIGSQKSQEYLEKGN